MLDGSIQVLKDSGVGRSPPSEAVDPKYHSYAVPTSEYSRLPIPSTLLHGWFLFLEWITFYFGNLGFL